MLNVASEKGGALSIFREAICNHVLSNASGIRAAAQFVRLRRNLKPLVSIPSHPRRQASRFCSRLADGHPRRLTAMACPKPP